MNNYFLPEMASVSDLQRNYAALIKKVKKSGRPLLVLKKNKLQAVLLGAAVYQKITAGLINYEETQAFETIALYQKEKRAGKLKKMKKIEELFA